MNKRVSFAVDKVVQLAVSKVGFFSDLLYDFDVADTSGDKNSGLREARASKYVLVVGREHYFETVKEYPIGSRSELKAVLKNELFSGPFEGELFFSIERLSDKTHRVTSWAVKRDFLNRLSFKPFIIIPETACIELPSLGGGVRLSRAGQIVQAAATGNGLISSFNRADATNKNTMQEKLLSSLGMQDDITWSELDQYDASRLMLAGVWRVVTTSPFDFLAKRDPVNFQGFPWQKGGLLACLMVTFYMLLSSAFLVAHDAWLNQKLSADAVRADVALDLRRELKELTELRATLGTALSKPIPYWVTWPVFLDLVNEENLMVGNRTSNKGVTFIGRSVNATDTLARLKQDPRVATAKFKLPVITIAGLEAFTIDLVFKALSDEDIPIGDEVTQYLTDEVEGVDIELSGARPDA